MMMMMMIIDSLKDRLIVNYIGSEFEREIEIDMDIHIYEYSWCIQSPPGSL